MMISFMCINYSYVAVIVFAQSLPEILWNHSLTHSLIPFVGVYALLIAGNTVPFSLDHLIVYVETCYFFQGESPLVLLNHSPAESQSC